MASSGEDDIDVDDIEEGDLYRQENMKRRIEKRLKNPRYHNEEEEEELLEKRDKLKKLMKKRQDPIESDEGGGSSQEECDSDPDGLEGTYEEPLVVDTKVVANTFLEDMRRQTSTSVQVKLGVSSSATSSPTVSSRQNDEECGENKEKNEEKQNEEKAYLGDKKEMKKKSIKDKEGSGLPESAHRPNLVGLDNGGEIVDAPIPVEKGKSGDVAKLLLEAVSFAGKDGIYHPILFQAIKRVNRNLTDRQFGEVLKSKLDKEIWMEYSSDDDKRMYYSVEFKPQRSSVVVDAATSTDGKRKLDAVMIEDQQLKKSRLEVNRSLSAASIPSSSFSQNEGEQKVSPDEQTINGKS